MAARNPERRRLSARAAAIERHNGPDDPRLTELQAELAALAIGEISEWAKRAAAALPAFDAGQIAAAGRAAAVIDARIARTSSRAADAPAT